MPLFIYTEFSRNAVQPVECLKAGWNLIKDQYWLFVGISVVGIIIGSVVPLGILLGPMMCGIYLAMFQRQRGETVEFGTLFKGFDYFGDSLIATLLHMIPIVIIMVPFYLFIFLGSFLMVPDRSGGVEQVEPAAPAGFLLLFFGGFLVITLMVVIVSVLFTFAYPLIVDRKLSGVEAVKLSMKAAWANFWRLLGLLLLNWIMGVVGVLFCYVGVFLVMPIGFAAISVAYDQVFGLDSNEPRYPPPPPASFA